LVSLSSLPSAMGSTTAGWACSTVFVRDTANPCRIVCSSSAAEISATMN